ncbi:MAG: F0F1 ATP synthase subunit B [Candidatus Latescibacter sp.]|nr:F0F1 ATP synthase subunit B [Candidatus Latescibacter sp.]
MISINATIILTMVNFILLVILLRAILFKPLLKYLDERSKTIAESLRLAEENRIRSEEIHIEHDNIVREARTKAAEIVEKAVGAASDESHDIIKAARVQALATVDAAKDEILTEAEHIKQDLRKEMAELSISLAEKILTREIKESDHRDLINRSFGALG